MSLAHFGDHWYWEGFSPEKYGANADAATLRQGLGRRAGSMPALWRFHRIIVPDSVAQHGFDNPKLTAEHATLTLFGWHQQSQQRSMHRSGVSLGAALRALRHHDPNMDRRVEAAATCEHVDAVVHHLRGLVTRLRAVGQPMDYTGLLHDIYYWQFPDARRRVRLRWGAAYHAWTPPRDSTTDTDTDTVPVASS